MKIGKTVKKLIKGMTVIILLVIFSQSSHAQIVEKTIHRQSFISREYRPRWFDRYENFGNYDLRRYKDAVYYVTGLGSEFIQYEAESPNLATRGYVSPVSYDQFGNFLLPGGEIYSMAWNKSRIGTYDGHDSQWVGSGNGSGIFNNLMITADEFSNWQTRFMIARRLDNGRGGLRAYFTPSTLKITNFDGFRWDASSRKNNITVLASPDYRGTGRSGENSQPLYGVHWQSNLGDIMKVGATFVSRQRGTISDSHQDLDRWIKDEPRYLYILVTDDSPEDSGSGARVYDIRAIIDGKQEPVSFNGENYRVRGRMFRIENLLEKKRYFDKAFQSGYLFRDDDVSGVPYIARDISEIRNNRGSWILDLLKDKPTMHNFFSKTDEIGSVGYLSILRDDVMNDIGDPFNLWPTNRQEPDVVPYDPNKTEPTRYFKADMSGGYVEAIGTDVIIYEIELPSGTRDAAFNVLVSNDYCIDIVAPLYTFRQTDEADFYDNPQSDAWNARWSIDTYEKRHCAKSPGNVSDSSNQKWVKVRYDRMTGMNVYGMNMELNWRGLFVRAEYNESNTRWSMPLQEKLSGATNTEYTSRAWFINAEKNFGKWSIGTELFDYPNEYMQYWATIDDNDDDDSFVGGSEYPGLDADFDLMIDTTWRNEPFLDYFYDEIVVGDDFNHNGTVDSRENDNQIDLPYEQDSSGQHYFLKVRPRLATILTIGHYDINQEYQGGRNFTRYLKFEHHQRIRGIGEFLFYNRTERIKDDYKLPLDSRTRLQHHQLVNNWKMTNILSTRMNFIPNTNIINNFRFVTTYEIGDMLRPDGTTDEVIQNFLSVYNDGEEIKRYGSYSYSMEHKIDYTFRLADARVIPEVRFRGFRLLSEKRIKELKFMPMLKVVHSHGFNRYNDFALRREHRRSRVLDIYPIIRFDYRIAPKTRLRFGVQGITEFPQIHREKGAYMINDLNDSDVRNFVLAVENQTLYQGFNLNVLGGMRFTKTKYINDPGKIDPGATEYFITVQSEATQ